MGITLELPDELVSELSARAAQLGLPLAEYARRVLASVSASDKLHLTGADVVAYWQREGLIGTRSDITDSQQHARMLRAQAERRNRP